MAFLFKSLLLSSTITAGSFYSNRNFAFTSIGSGFTNNQSLQQSQIINNAQAILNRL